VRERAAVRLPESRQPESSTPSDQVGQYEELEGRSHANGHSDAVRADILLSHSFESMSSGQRTVSRKEPTLLSIADSDVIHFDGLSMLRLARAALEDQGRQRASNLQAVWIPSDFGVMVNLRICRASGGFEV
jgi:hypothetical protein